MTTFLAMDPLNHPARTFKGRSLATATRHGLGSNPMIGYVVMTMNGVLERIMRMQREASREIYA